MQSPERLASGVKKNRQKGEKKTLIPMFQAVNSSDNILPVQMFQSGPVNIILNGSEKTILKMNRSSLIQEKGLTDTEPLQ